MKNVFTFIFCFSFQFVFCQSYESFVFDTDTKNPIVFASIYTTQNTGVISNAEGAFKINVDNLSQSDSLFISSLGYETRAVSATQLKTLDTIFLKEQKEMLSDVVVSANKLSANQIVQRFLDSLEKRHHIGLTKFKTFKRTHHKLNPLAFNFDLKKATSFSRTQRKTFNEKAEKYFKNIKNQYSNTYQDVLYNSYYSIDSTGMDYIKGTKLVNVKRDNSTENIQKNIFKELLTVLDTPSTFKVKSGLFPIDDSLSTEEFIRVKDSLKKDTLQNKYSKSRDALKSLTQNLNKIEIFNEPDHYKFTLEDTNIFDGEVVYQIRFEPDHRKAIYKGSAYINAEDFGLMRLDYQLIDGEKEQGLNMKLLLGLEYKIDQSEYQMIYQRQQNGKYFPKYYRFKKYQYVYLDRNLKFKENTDDRRNRIKLKLNLHIENSDLKQTEYLFMNPEAFTIESNAFNPEDYVYLEKIERYDPKIWEEFDIIQATEGIKNYKY